MSSERQQQLRSGSALSAGILMAAVLFAMVNYLSHRHYQRWDWTSSQLYTLSEKSLNVARNLDVEIDTVIFLSPGSELYGPVDELLSRYVAANPGKISKREIDPAKNRIEAQRLVEKFSIDRENVIVIATENDRRVIGEFELAEYDYSGAQYGEGPTLQEFKGEKLITSAILALVEAKKPRILFSTGHGEASLDPGGDRSLSQARDLLGSDNFEIEQWGSLGKDSVPDDCDLLVIAGPTTNFIEPELQILTDYLDRGGRMLVLLDPVLNAAQDGLAALGLEDWLENYGILAGKDIVIDPSSTLPFFGPETIFTSSYGSHAIVEALQQTQTQVLISLARSVRTADEIPDGIELEQLISTSDQAWAETNFEEIEVSDDDLRGPVGLAVAMTIRNSAEHEAMDSEEAGPESGEGSTATEPNVDVPDEDDPSSDARLVVLGDLDFASNAQIHNGANQILLLNTLNWLVKREQLIDIEGRKPEQTSLVLNRAELSSIYWLVLLIMPGLTVALGIWVYLQRRR